MWWCVIIAVLAIIGVYLYKRNKKVDLAGIPAPKFKIGDIVDDIWNVSKSFKIENCVYSVTMQKWYYYSGGSKANKNSHAEHNLRKSSSANKV